MNEFETAKKKRFIKQVITAVIFPVVVIGGWFYPVLGYFIPICMLAGISIAFWKGRKWCDWYCPRGGFFDTAAKTISPNKEIPAFFKKTSTRVVMLIILMTAMTTQIIRVWPNWQKIGAVFVIMLTVTTTLAVILAIIYHPRVWCCFCPIGSISNWVGKGKKPLKIDSNLCIECRRCHKICPIGVSAYKFKNKEVEKVMDGDCLKCGLCAAVCPKKALKL
ncbi:MAG: 4Fe-4S dicluster domain-containing protein [Sedimentisphaerales bacterium]|nr:4Fe-4S dicluster domain-containing protein [Sedimentisphaerales bacterium]